MANKGRSEKNIFGGGYTHYDSNGKKIGRSEPNIFGGGYTNYDANGKKVGRKHHIIIVAEGIGGSYEMAKVVEERTGVETRATILGHIQRGGAPTMRDRLVAAQMGMKAVELLKQGKSNRVVIMKADRIEDVDINEGLAMTKTISEDDYVLADMLSR